ncbi:hypothetical protein QOT17_007819 [Balamuthia mandrillaris]
MQTEGELSHRFPFLELPRELQLSTLLWLAPLVASENGDGDRDLFHCHLVCKQFLEVLREDHFWQALLQMGGAVAEGSGSSLPEDVQSWKQLYQLQFIHVEVAQGGEELLRIDNRKRSVTLIGNHEYHTRVYASRDWHSGKHYWEVTYDHTKEQIFAGVLPSKACNTHIGIIGHFGDGWSIVPYTGVINGHRGKDHRQWTAKTSFEWIRNGDVVGICLNIDEGFCFFVSTSVLVCFLFGWQRLSKQTTGRLDYWRNGQYMTGLQSESIKQLGPYRAAVSLMFKEEKVTFNFNAPMRVSIPPPEENSL